jgi:hypothetical protein
VARNLARVDSTITGPSGRKVEDETIVSPEDISFNDSSNISDTHGFDKDNNSWVGIMDREEEEKHNDTASQAKAGGSKGEKEKSKKKGKEELSEKARERLRKRKVQKRENASEKKKRTRESGVTWADVANDGRLVCHITSEDLEIEMDQDHFNHVQTQWMDLVEQVEDFDVMEKLSTSKAGISDGIINIAFNHKEGVRWFQSKIKEFKPLKEGQPRYEFYENGRKPYYTFTAITTDLTSAESSSRMIRIMKGFNPSLRKGRMAISKVETKEKIAVLKVRVGEELLKPLAEMNYQVMFGLGTIELRPNFPATPSNSEEVVDVEMA